MFNLEEIMMTWNDLLPECKITKKELEHPTEQFLINTLMSYLHVFWGPIAPAFVPVLVDESEREKRIFKLKLAKQIDYIYKITDDDYSFYYMDLLNPTPKKSAHLLRILINYLCYSNMYKKDVEDRIQDRIRALRDSRKQLLTVQQQNEELAVRKQQIKQSIAELEQVNHKLTQETGPMEIRVKESLNKVKLEEEDNKKLEADLKKLQEIHSELKRQIVSDKDAAMLHK